MHVICAHFRLTGSMSGFSVCFLRMSGSWKAFFIFFIWLTCRETGHGSRKIFINSENARGRRPVTGHNSRKDPTTPDNQNDGCTMTEAEILGLIRRAGGISQQTDEQATQPDSVTAENYARVVAEVMRRDGIQLNDMDMRNIRIRVLEMLAYNRRVTLYRETEKITYHWKKPERLRR